MRKFRFARPFPRKRIIATILPLVPLLVLFCVVLGFLGNEDAVKTYFRQHRKAHPVVTEALDWFSDYGNIPYYVVYGLLLIKGIRNRKRKLVHFVGSYLLALVTTLLLVEVAKIVVGRPRPPVDGGFDPFTRDRRYQSFPSAHVAETLMTVSPLSQFIGSPAVSLLLGMSPAVMALSRMYLGRHHPSDFLGSILVALVGVHSFRLYRCLFACGGSMTRRVVRLARRKGA